MAANKSIGRLVLDLVANTAGFTKSIDKAKGSLKASAKSMKNDIAALALGFKALATGAVATAAFNYFDKVDAALKKISVSTSAAARAQNDLRKVAMDAYKKMPSSIEQASDAVIAMSNYTKTNKESFQAATETALAFAKMTGQDVKTSVYETAKTLRDFNIDTKETAAAMDLLYRISNSTGVGVDKLQSVLADSGDTLGKVGYGYAESAMLLAKMEQSGIDTTKALTAMNNVMNDVAKEGSLGPQEAWKRIGDYIKGAKDDSEALERAVSIFGEKAGKDFVQVFRDSAFEIKNTKETLDAMVGVIGAESGSRTIADSFSQAIKTLGESSLEIMNSLKDSFVALEVPLQILLGIINNLIRAVNISMIEISKLFGQNGGWGAIANKAMSPYFESANKYASNLTGYKELDLGTISRVVGNGSASSAAGTSASNPIASTALFAKPAEEALKNYNETWNKITANIRNSSETFKTSIGDAFKSVIKGTESVGEAFKNMASDIVGSILDIVMQATIIDPIANSLLSAVGFGLKSGTQTAIGGKFAEGGRPPMGVPSIVGELGPELFVPDTAGTVIPNGGLGNTFNFSFSVAADTPSAVVSSMQAQMNAFKQQIPTLVSSAISGGGGISRKLRR